MKKTLCIILSIAMVLSVLPVSVFAEETDTGSTEAEAVVEILEQAEKEALTEEHEEISHAAESAEIPEEIEETAEAEESSEEAKETEEEEEPVPEETVEEEEEAPDEVDTQETCNNIISEATIANDLTVVVEETSVSQTDGEVEISEDEASPVVVKAGKCGDDITYTLDSNGVLTLTGTGPMYESYFSLSRYAKTEWNRFSETPIVAVIISNGITSISLAAFSENKNLLSVDIPSSVTAIDACAFYGCIKLKEVVIPGTVKTIGDDAFESTGLENVTFCDGIERIGCDAFFRCDFEEITLPDSVVYIGASAFYNCENLVRVYRSPSSAQIETLPENRRLCPHAFAECDMLEYLEIPNHITIIGDDSITNSGNRVCANDNNLVEIKLPQDLVEIGGSAFYRQQGLTHIEFPYGLKTIGDKAFTGCCNLEITEIPETVESIGANAFGGCTFGRGQSIFTIPESIKNLPSKSFTSYVYASGGFEAFYLPHTEVPDVKAGFYLAKSLIYVPPHMYDLYTEEWIERAGTVKTGDGSGDNITVYRMEQIPLTLTAEYGTVSSVGSYHRPDEGYLPGEFVTITAEPQEGYKFVGWSSDDIELEAPTAAEVTFTMPESAVEITANFEPLGITVDSVETFNDIEVDLETTREEIASMLPEYVWVTLSDGSSILLPVIWDTSAYIPEPGEYEIPGELLLPEDITNPAGVKATVTVFIRVDGQPVIVGFEGLEDMTVPCGTAADGLSLPAAVTVVYEIRAKDVVLGTGKVLIGVCWDSGAYRGTEVGSYLLRGTLQDVPSILQNPDGLYPQLRVTVAAAQQWEMGKENGGDIVAYLYEDPNADTEEAYVLELIGTGEMRDIQLANLSPWKEHRGKITQVVVGEGITGIGKYAFCLMPNLQTVSLPEGLVTIGENSFNTCTGLEEIVIPSTVETIGASAFYGCKALTSITFEDKDGTLQSIGANAFKPSKANLRTTVTVWESNTAAQEYPWNSEGRITNIIVLTQ